MSIGNANSYGDSHAHGNTYYDPKSYSYGYSYTDADCDPYGDSYSDLNSYTYGNTDRDSYSYPYTDADPDCDSHRYAYPNHTYCARELDTWSTCSGPVLDRRDFESGRRLPQRRVNRHD